jgi:hypothetical protein
VRHRVVVEVEAGVRGFADFDLDALVYWKGLSRQWKQATTLVVERITNRA